MEPEFAEPFVSAVREISLEEKKSVIVGTHENQMVAKEQQILEPQPVADNKTIKPQETTDTTEKPVQIEKREPKEKDVSDISYKGLDLQEFSQNVISCLGHISENYYFGISILISVLCGGHRKQIIKYNLTEVQEYGIYANMSRDDMRAIIQWMINNHYILKTKAKYPVLHPTYNGNHIDECITKKQLKDLKKYLEDPNREIFEDEDNED